ncbi:PIN domain-containing protein [Candidatus Woesearchaeota archaeon]|nr:PIN domain-containing protein [Candidatus Woesearchaeota archaeon]
MKSDTGNLPALIDTNVLVYAYAEMSPKRQKAVEVLEACFRGQAKHFLSLQSIGEFCSVAIKKYGLEISDVLETAQELLCERNLVKLQYDGETLQHAFALMNQGLLSFWDAVLVATMKENAIETIYTEDANFGKVEGIKAVNPFRE